MGMAQTAAPFADVFIKAGMPQDVIAQLRRGGTVDRVRVAATTARRAQQPTRASWAGRRPLIPKAHRPRYQPPGYYSVSRLQPLSVGQVTELSIERAHGDVP